MDQVGASGGLEPLGAEVPHPAALSFAPKPQTSSEIVRTMLRMSEVTTSSGAPYTQPLSSNEVGSSAGAPKHPDI